MSSIAKNNNQLTPHQEAAMERLLASTSSLAVSALLGNAGTGKTFLLGVLIDRLPRLTVCMAPTHKSALVLSQKTARTVKTIHSYLGLKPDNENPTGFKRNGPVKLPRNALYILDEASMVSGELLDMLFDAAEDRDSKILLVGDPAQLPPVMGVGGVVFEEWAVEKSGSDAIVRLTEIVRQEEGSAIPAVAHQYRDREADFAMPTASVIRPNGSLIMRDFDEGIAEYVEAAAGFTLTEVDRVFLAYTNARNVQDKQLVRPRM